MRLQRAVTSKQLDRFFSDFHPFPLCVLLFITHVYIFLSVFIKKLEISFVPNYALRPGKYLIGKLDLGGEFSQPYFGITKK